MPILKAGPTLLIIFRGDKSTSFTTFRSKNWGISLISITIRKRVFGNEKLAKLAARNASKKALSPLSY